MKDKALQSPTNVRLDGESTRRLRVLSKRMKVSASRLVREAVLEKLPIWEKQGITIR